MRKLVSWFGPLEEFIYIDTDIIVFEDINTGEKHSNVSNADGTFSTSLPTGHSFLIKIIGFGEEEE